MWQRAARSPCRLCLQQSSSSSPDLNALAIECWGSPRHLSRVPPARIQDSPRISLADGIGMSFVSLLFKVRPGTGSFNVGFDVR